MDGYRGATEDLTLTLFRMKKRPKMPTQPANVSDLGLQNTG